MIVHVHVPSSVKRYGFLLGLRSTSVTIGIEKRRNPEYIRRVSICIERWTGWRDMLWINTSHTIMSPRCPDITKQTRQ